MVEAYKTDEMDALSRLIQLHAKRHDIRLTWSGRGVNDLTELLSAHAMKARLAKHLWTGLRDLMLMPELREMPEAVQAQIMSTVLKSQALVDLETQAHKDKLAAKPPKPGAA